MMPQKDNLCGAFWGALVLTAAGVEGADQDLVALESGTLLPEGGEPPPLAGVDSRVDYRLDLPPAPKAESGTPGRGLAIAIERLSAGSPAAVPVARPRARGCPAPGRPRRSPIGSRWTGRCP